VLKAEPPGEEERWTGPVMGVEVDGKPFSEEVGGEGGDALGESWVMVKPTSEEVKAGVRPHSGKTGGGDWNIFLNNLRRSNIKK
jgi:hypothetical protein